jgi:PhnB protein
MNEYSTFFAPQLFFKVVAPAIEFYKKALGAVELRRWSNDDGSVHVAELSIDGALFHLHEEVSGKSQKSPESLNGTCVLIGLFVEDVAGLMTRAGKAGGTVTNPVTDYEYGYRQGNFTDPFGHQWLIEKKIGSE